MHRRKHKHRVWRKNAPISKALTEWSRMLHLWWKRDALDKLRFKRKKGYNEFD